MPVLHPLVHPPDTEFLRCAPELAFTIPGGMALQLRPIDLPRDLATLHAWLTSAYGRYWDLQGHSVESIEAIFRERLAMADRTIRMIEDGATGVPLCLAIVYLPQTDELGAHYAVRKGDRGVHLCVAPPPRPAPDLAYWALQAITQLVISDPSACRAVAEPDLANVPAIRRFLQAGYVRGDAVYLPYKTAQMVYLTGPAAATRNPPPPLPPLPGWWAWRHWHRVRRAAVTRLPGRRAGAPAIPQVTPAEPMRTS